MSDDYQIIIPPSFIEIYSDRRRRLTVTLGTLRERYDLCEDLANQLVDFASGIHHDLGVSADEVLARCRRGLLASPSQVEPFEARWIERRLAELLGWPWAEWDAEASPAESGAEPEAEAESEAQAGTQKGLPVDTPSGSETPGRVRPPA